MIQICKKLKREAFALEVYCLYMTFKRDKSGFNKY